MKLQYIYTTTLYCLTTALAWPQTGSLQDLGGLVTPNSKPVIYVGHEVLTMDSKKPKAEAVAVRDGQFLAVGTLAEVKSAAGEDAKVDRRFADKVICAGFVEQHVHPVLAALTMNSKVISIEDWDAIDGFSAAVRDEKTYAGRLSAALQAHKNKSKTFVSWGYHHYFHGEMSRTILDNLAPDFPVIIWHRSCHEFYLNTAAMKSTGIDEALMASWPKSAQDQASYEKGHFFEQGAMAILGKISPAFATPALFKRGLEFTEDYYHRNGITVCAEPGGFFSKPMQDAINAVYSDEDTPFAHYFMADGKTFAARNPKDAKALITDTEQVLSWGNGRTAYLPKQVKLLTDGAIYSQLMMMKDGYTDGHHGAWIMDPPVFDYAFQSYWDAGYQIHVHNNGDAGLQVLVDSLDKAMKRNPREDHRTVLVHFGFASPELVDRWAKLGGVVSANPYYVTALAGRYAKLGVGPERSKNMVPLGDVIRNKMPLSFHSDMPMAPAKPMQLVWAGVNRLTAEGDVSGPEHKVSVETALKAITLDAAHSIQLEKQVGSIEVGKLANLTILDKSPYEVEPTALKEIAVIATMSEGRVFPVKSGGKKSAAMGESAAPSLIASPASIHQPSRLMNRWSPPTLCGGNGCACSMGKALAAAMFAPNP
jgi:predicted amidohydrolase YtcJ